MIESEVAPTLLDQLRKSLHESPVPMTLKELAKGLTKPPKQKAPEFEASIAQELSEDLSSAKAFVYPSGKAGAERYWSKDEKQLAREAVLAAAGSPAKLPDLFKKASVAKPDKAFAEAIVRELIAEQKLFAHPAKKPEGPELFGTVPPPPPPPPLIDSLRKVSSESATPQTVKELLKVLPNPTKQKPAEFEQSVVALLAQEVAAGSLFASPSGAKGSDRYWTRDEKQAIREAVLTAAEVPTSEADLLTVAKKVTEADKAFLASLFEQLIEEKQIHPQSSAKKPLYGKEQPRPPHAFDRDPGKKAFAALVKAAQKCQEVASLVSLDEIFQRLRKALEQPHIPSQPAAPNVPVSHPVSTAHEEANRVKTSSHQTPVPPEKLPEPLVLSPERIRTALKDAYEELCLDVEFQDKLVEIRRIYHEAKRNLPELNVELFHRELKLLQKARSFELQAINEVQRAKETELAIRDGDQLLYYAIER